MCKNIKKFILLPIHFILVLSVTFSSIFSFPIRTHAQTKSIGEITGENVRLRSTPTTKKENNKNNILLELEEGSKVTLVSSNKVDGYGCEEGWYQVVYGNITGYICSFYVRANNNYDKYDRPWTSPKKAIVGGAKFISNSYISRGQFTSYLKKFNVNPNGDYEMYNHLYMSNIMAPSSEAGTSYEAYKKNGLLDLPLVFNIPVFRHMEDEYNRPGGNLTTVAKQKEITDQAFENELDKQGFPESYKEALRSLHTKYPNWTFIAMNTDERFSRAVLNFRISGAVQGEEKYFEDMPKTECEGTYGGNYKNGYCQTEAGWYVPNDETVGYYLDPRNFLTEKYILQFESLENSSNYIESVVQSILKSTYMADISILDNQSYASIFVEAGRIANVSSVYLASLAKQETGTNGSISTSGEAFEYEGQKYSGLYNFYNIGAVSSASSPVKAGLVYASGGICTECSTNQGNNEPNLPSIDLPSNSQPTVTLESIIKEAGYKIENEYVSGFKIGDTVDDVYEKLKNENVEIKSDGKRIGTGNRIKFNDESYTVIVYGDLTGDGEINSADLLKMRQYLLGKTSLSGAFKEAAYIADQDKINSANLLKLRQYLLGKTKISQS